DRTRRDGRAALVFYGGIPCTAHLTKLGRCRTQTRAPSGVSRSLAPTSPDSHVRSGATGVSGGTLGTGRRAPLAARRARGGALVWTMPLVGALVRRTLHRLGVGGVNADTLDTVASSPVALAVLLGVVIVATVFALADVTVFTVIAHLSLEGEPVTFTGVFARSWRTVRKATGWQGMLLVPYLALLVPISGIGFSSVLTEHIALPKFISGELLKTTTGAVLYGLA